MYIVHVHVHCTCTCRTCSVQLLYLDPLGFRFKNNPFPFQVFLNSVSQHDFMEFSVSYKTKVEYAENNYT